MIDLSPFPNNVGTILTNYSFDSSSSNLKFTLPTKTILRIYGIAGAGKGTLAQKLTNYFGITNLETSYILRSATYIYQTLGLEFNDQNTDAVFDQIIIKLPSKNLQFFWNIKDEVKELTDIELRSNLVQQNVSIYSGNPYFRTKYYNKINYILNNLISSAVILDGRGSNTPYLNQAEQDGFNVIRLFLWSNDEVNYNRYKSAYLVRHNLSVLDQEQEQTCYIEFQKNIAQRNLQDYNNAVANNMGTLSQDTGIIDSSYLSPDQVFCTALNFIKSRLW